MEFQGPQRPSLWVLLQGTRPASKGLGLTGPRLREWGGGTQGNGADKAQSQGGAILGSGTENSFCTSFIISQGEGVGIVASLKIKFYSSKQTNGANSFSPITKYSGEKKNPHMHKQNKSTKIPQHTLVQHSAAPTPPADTLFLLYSFLKVSTFITHRSLWSVCPVQPF